MKCLVLLVATFVAVSAQTCGKPGPSDVVNNIINGVNAAKGEIPWQLALERQGLLGGYGHSCGAVLLSDKWVMTACHCVSGGGDDVEEIRLVAGQHKRSDPESSKQILKAKQIILHPKCDLSAGGVPYDYAIVELASAADLSKPEVSTVCLPPKDAKYDGNKDCWVSGWGRISGDPDNNTLADNLQKGKTNVLTQAACQKAMEGVAGVTISDYHVCVQNQQADMGACSGDSGGPLQCRNSAGAHELVGVASWVIVNDSEDCIRSFPNAYANIPFVVDWIKQTTGIQ